MPYCTSYLLIRDTKLYSLLCRQITCAYITNCTDGPTIAGQPKSRSAVHVVVRIYLPYRRKPHCELQSKNCLNFPHKSKERPGGTRYRLAILFERSN